MADVLTMSENAATLAKQLGDHLKAQGSTAEIKSMGSRIVETATTLQQEVQRRRTTRKAPAKSILPPGERAMNYLLKKREEAKASATKAVENATTVASESITAAAKKPLMSFKKGVLTRLPNITGGARRTHRVRKAH
jgi:hypothetical protein